MRGHCSAIAFKEHLFRARLFFPLGSLRNELYLISAALMVLLAILRKLFIGKILAVHGDKNGHIALVKLCACSATSVVCGYWLSEARVFLLQKRRENAGTPVTCVIHYFAILPASLRNTERGQPRLVRRMYIFGQNKIDRARGEHALAPDGFNFNLSSILKGLWKVRGTN